ncbi:MAG: aminopeptidase, partial [Oscillospiraceae bacterium]|nr:aminopeptidase [Oscillospiraceae bacterium]
MIMTNKELYEDLSYKTKTVYEEINETQTQEMQTLCDDYKRFLDMGKTERECVKISIDRAERAGFVPFDSKKELSAGDKVYTINRDKNIFLAVIGKEPIENGVNLVGAHIDSPRLDLKQNPLYQSCDMALLKTHYYGGIKKYQWTAVPLALHGIIFTKDGEKKNISLGEKDDEPVFCITDLLPHLAKDQMSKKMTDGIDGESLNILIGGMGIYDNEVKEQVKFRILKILFEKYGIRERDFLSAEIEAVPAFKARDVGLDASFIGAYGQDDRVCAFTSLEAICGVNN